MRKLLLLITCMLSMPANAKIIEVQNVPTPGVSSVYIWEDTSNNVRCWIWSSYQKGGISCLSINTLGDKLNEKKSN